MAKHLKAIKCPTCGSPQQTEIRPDTYRCASCGTEYFLDSDDITIHVQQGPAPAPGWPAVSPAELKRRGRWALAVLALGLLWSVGAYFWQRHQRARADLALHPTPS